MISCLIPPPNAELPDPNTPACNAVLGPVGAPERPDLPGADRIVAGDVVHAIPELGLVGDDGGDFLVPLPPTAAYGFRRQPDGSFAEPFVLAFDMHGLNNAPFGFHFLDGDVGRVLFSWDDVSSPEQDGDLFVADVEMGVPNWFGEVSYGFVVDPPPTPWPVASIIGLQSNPCVVDGVTLYDQHLPESDAFNSDVYVDDGSTTRVVGFSRPDREEFQPFVHGEDVYAAGAFESIVASAFDGGDWADTGAFGPERLVVGAVGRIASVGEPSVAVRDGVVSVYFLAGRLTATGGIDAMIARVSAAP
jgi:hypothetical protein